MNFISIIAVVIFAGLFGFFKQKLLPNEFLEGNNNRYDERETRILLEIFSNTLIWLVFGLLLSFILRITGSTQKESIWFDEYPEVIFIIMAIVLFLFHYFYAKIKYKVEVDE